MMSFQAESKGRWWIIGSAFTGNLVGTTREDDQTVAEAKQGTGEQFSDKLLELARKMRMNTDIRRTVFCLIMSAEDYMDCAEKLVKLGTKNQTEREVVFVVTDCCLQVREVKKGDLKALQDLVRGFLETRQDFTGPSVTSCFTN